MPNQYAQLRSLAPGGPNPDIKSDDNVRRPMKVVPDPESLSTMRLLSESPLSVVYLKLLMIMNIVSNAYLTIVSIILLTRSLGSTVIFISMVLVIQLVRAVDFCIDQTTNHYRDNSRHLDHRSVRFCVMPIMRVLLFCFVIVISLNELSTKTLSIEPMIFYLITISLVFIINHNRLEELINIMVIINHTCEDRSQTSRIDLVLKKINPDGAVGVITNCSFDIDTSTIQSPSFLKAGTNNIEGMSLRWSNVLIVPKSYKYYLNGIWAIQCDSLSREQLKGLIIHNQPNDFQNSSLRQIMMNEMDHDLSKFILDRILYDDGDKVLVRLNKFKELSVHLINNNG
jgi:hypothetical protein